MIDRVNLEINRRVYVYMLLKTVFFFIFKSLVVAMFVYTSQYIILDKTTDAYCNKDIETINCLILFIYLSKFLLCVNRLCIILGVSKENSHQVLNERMRISKSIRFEKYGPDAFC